ncbi:50S ribosomal protein L11 [Candidatus Wirthbacteria bacterium CG2_30_54_11]|uniref:Large ribosomal subunit protein uL11 n=1 Tax=Candidatus Wirthbacteria bacterium CG2_30_54_11 TaxID=1817892 RepID=A0A1J5IJ86_9BACT|nr:MAG: 50S ribosomal protein L11 [Candidatus Wirthbacteria bacterium CG2_30_54_11]
MAKKVKVVLKLNIDAGKANPAPPVGTALGPHGVNLMEFCNAYNAQTKDKMGSVVPVEITVYEDRSFTFVLKTPPVSNLIKKALGIPKGSAQPNRQYVGTLTRQQVTEIATLKKDDLNANDIAGAEKIIMGTAHGMGVEIEK